MTMPLDLYLLLYTQPQPSQEPAADDRLGLVEGGALLAWVGIVIGLVFS